MTLRITNNTRIASIAVLIIGFFALVVGYFYAPSIPDAPPQTHIAQEQEAATQTFSKKEKNFTSQNTVGVVKFFVICDETSLSIKLEQLNKKNKLAKTTVLLYDVSEEQIKVIGTVPNEQVGEEFKATKNGGITAGPLDKLDAAVFANAFLLEMARLHKNIVEDKSGEFLIDSTAIKGFTKLARTAPRHWANCIYSVK